MKLRVSAKCSDMCDVTLIDSNGKRIKDQDGYVPYGLGIGGGDYINFTLDLDTMKIVDSDVTPESIQAFIDGDDQ